MTRPHEITEELTQRLCHSLAVKALSLRCACELEGRPYDTVQGWLGKGRKAIAAGDHASDYAQFAHRIYRACRQSEEALIGVIQESAMGRVVVSKERETKRSRSGSIVTRVVTKRERRVDWGAAKYLLERRFPNEYAPVAKIEHQGEVGVKLLRIEGMLGGVLPGLASPDSLHDEPETLGGEEKPDGNGERAEG